MTVGKLFSLVPFVIKCSEHCTSGLADINDTYHWLTAKKPVSVLTLLCTENRPPFTLYSYMVNTFNSCTRISWQASGQIGYL